MFLFFLLTSPEYVVFCGTLYNAVLEKVPQKFYFSESKDIMLVNVKVTNRYSNLLVFMKRAQLSKVIFLAVHRTYQSTGKSKLHTFYQI